MEGMDDIYCVIPVKVACLCAALQNLDGIITVKVKQRMSKHEFLLT